EAKNKNDWRIKPSILTTVFGKPITQDHYANMTVERLKDKVKIEIQKMID
ncbi:MAG: hypothetical protein HOO21_03390, partial [Candidatus Marinimicrobia bacterium]|nr:hypothetical protein [Candidatus Neomarinimicrobiota bacterium]